MPSGVFFSVSNFNPTTQGRLEEMGATMLPSPDVSLLRGLDFEPQFYVAPVGHFLGAEILETLPSINVVASNTTSSDHIDVMECERRNITVLTLQGRYDVLSDINVTAELALGLAICLLRQIRPASESVEQGQWNRNDWIAERSLRDCRVGIVGMGRLGSMFRNYVDTLGASTQFYDPRLDNSCRSLESLLEGVDLLSIHAGGSGSEGLYIDKGHFSRMPRGALVVNTSRPHYLDYVGLFELVLEGHIGGVGTDVLPGEVGHSLTPDSTVSWLTGVARMSPSIIITPHIGGSSRSARFATEEALVNLLLGFYGSKGNS